MIGETLAQADCALYEEVQQALASGEMSPAAHMLREDEVSVVADKLKTAIVDSKCECGQPDCNTYRFAVPHKAHAVSHYTVRFHVRGELLLGVDSDGDIYKIERLCDPANAGPRTAYARQQDDTWQRIDIP